jgi:23S rRNA-/tRNA-specific pseudouridylate synthase
MAIQLDESPLPRIVYEDDRLVAVHKPTRMHSAPGLGSGDLCAWAFERYPELAEVRGEGSGRRQAEGGLLHRLDYETSGLVLFARDAEAFASLLEQQAGGAFYKEYVALASPSLIAEPQGSSPIRGAPSGTDPGAWAAARLASAQREAESSTLSEALHVPAVRGAACGIECAFRPFGPKGARVACMAEGGSGVAAIYRSDILGCDPIESSARGEGPELELRLGLARGFRHQIRAQLAWIGLPIAGDPIYGGAPDERLRLYAIRLSFAHPTSALPFSVSEVVQPAGF